MKGSLLWEEEDTPQVPRSKTIPLANPDFKVEAAGTIFSNAYNGGLEGDLVFANTNIPVSCPTIFFQQANKGKHYGKIAVFDFPEAKTMDLDFVDDIARGEKKFIKKAQSTFWLFKDKDVCTTDETRLTCTRMTNTTFSISKLLCSTSLPMCPSLWREGFKRETISDGLIWIWQSSLRGKIKNRPLFVVILQTSSKVKLKIVSYDYTRWAGIRNCPSPTKRILQTSPHWSVTKQLQASVDAGIPKSSVGWSGFYRIKLQKIIKLESLIKLVPPSSTCLLEKSLPSVSIKIGYIILAISGIFVFLQFEIKSRQTTYEIG